MKHWANSHPGPEKPKFYQYVIASFKSSLNRQVAETVRIQHIALSEEGASWMEETSERSRKSKKREATEDTKQGNKRRKFEEHGLVTSRSHQ